MARPVIRRLSNHVVDLIAAGEVVERPAAALKELVENALDAGASRIEVILRGGGCELIEVSDNGRGMEADELTLAIERHCTSKLPDDNLTAIRTLGFRGEALPSIGASARLSLTSRTAESDSAWELTVEGGTVSAPVPAAGTVGTRAVVRDLFFATPARRKFLKTARVEGNHAESVMRRVALSAPDCAIAFTMEGREVFNLPVQDMQSRVAAVLGVPVDGLLAVDEQRGPMRLTGYICGPGQTRRTGAGQFILVNHRPVVDPVLRTAVRVAYRPVIERGRFPVLLLHLQLPLERVDVNVHPAKTELRFADEAEVRGFVIGAVGRALARNAGEGGGIQADLGIIGRRAAAAAGQGRPASQFPQSRQVMTDDGAVDFGFGTSVRQFSSSPAQGGEAADMAGREVTGFSEGQRGYAASSPAFGGGGDGAVVAGMTAAERAAASAFAEAAARSALEGSEGAMGPGVFPDGATIDAGLPCRGSPGEKAAGDGASDHEKGRHGVAGNDAAIPAGRAASATQPLGVPIGQIHATYILSIAPDGDLILTDQHAAHERLTHERLRARFAEGVVKAQALLMPEVVDLPPASAAALLECGEELAGLGLEIESFGTGSVLVRSLPAPLSGGDVAGLLRDVAEELTAMPDLSARQTDSLDGRFEAIMARMACHGSIRAGRILKQEEMNALLRGMEAHPRANTCPHGRPTWLRLDRDGLEKLFGRTK